MRTCERENKPIIIGIIDRPDSRNDIPKVYLGNPVDKSIPTSPITKPNTPAVSPFITDPLTRLPIIVSPNTAIKKYSGALNFKEIKDSGGANKSRATALIQPPITDEIVLTPRALRPCPLRVSLYPSRAVAAEAGVPGV